MSFGRVGDEEHIYSYVIRENASSDVKPALKAAAEDAVIGDLAFKVIDMLESGGGYGCSRDGISKVARRVLKILND